MPQTCMYGRWGQPFLRGLIQNLLQPPTLMREAVAAQHLKMTASLVVRVRQALIMEPLTAATVQMMKAPAAVSLAVKSHQMMRVPSRMVQTMKARGQAVRQRSQMQEATTAPPIMPHVAHFW